jgi:hypothetical protein
MNRPGGVEHECHDSRCVDGSPPPWVRASMTSVFPWLGLELCIGISYFEQQLDSWIDESGLGTTTTSSAMKMLGDGSDHVAPRAFENAVALRPLELLFVYLYITLKAI